MQGAGTLLSIVLVQLAVCLLTLRFATPKISWVQQPVTWFYSFWVFGLFLLALPIFKYYEEFNALSGSILILILLCFSLGCLVAEFSTQARSKDHVKTTIVRSNELLSPTASSQKAARWIRLSLITGAIGILLVCTNSLLSGQLSIADRLDPENAAAIRDQQLTGAVSAIGPLLGPANAMSAVGLLGLIGYAYFLGRGQIIEIRRPGTRLALYLYILSAFIAAMFFFGGRMTFVFTLLLGAFGYIEGRWSIGQNVITLKLSAKQWLGFLVLSLVTLISMFAAATYFLEKRVASRDPAKVLYRTHRAQFDPAISDLVHASRTSEYFLVSVSYVTTPIPTLAYYLELPESRTPGPFYGEYNFPAIARWTRRFTGDFYPFYWELARREIFGPLDSINFGSNVWSTMVRDLVADFGRVGSMIFVFGLGLTSQLVFISQRRAPKVTSASLLVFLRLILLFSGLISIFFMPQIYWPLYLIIGLFMVQRRRSVSNMSSHGLGTRIRA